MTGSDGVINQFWGHLTGSGLSFDWKWVVLIPEVGCPWPGSGRFLKRKWGVTGNRGVVKIVTYEGGGGVWWF